MVNPYLERPLLSSVVRKSRSLSSERDIFLSFCLSLSICRPGIDFVGSVNSVGSVGFVVGGV